MKTLLQLTLTLLLSSSIFSQHNRCGTHSHWVKNKENNQELSTQKEELERFTKTYVDDIATGKRKKTNTEITIPVVVHVIYNTETENISDEQINSQITVLNEDFNNENSDAITDSDVDFAFFNERSSGANIRFQLANTDPQGDITTGITRTFTTIQGFDDNLTNMYFTANGGHDNWDPTSYLNIWVVALDENSSTLGWAQFPSSLSHFADTDGLVLRHEVFGTTGTAGTDGYSNYNLGRTATHEVGHWLNLSHIWGDQECGDDMVSDTPTAFEENYQCPTYPSNANSSCGTDERGEMYMNYMDYVNDQCMILFSTGQSTRMRAALEGARSELLTSNGITTTTTDPTTTALSSIDIIKNISIFPNPSQNGEFSISLDTPIDFVKVSDSYGRIIKQEIINSSNFTLDLTAYSSGIYYLELNVDGFTSTQKIVKQ